MALRRGAPTRKHNQDVVLTIRLNADNPSEKSALEVLATWQARKDSGGYPLTNRYIVTAALAALARRVLPPADNEAERLYGLADQFEQQLTALQSMIDRIPEGGTPSRDAVRDAIDKVRHIGRQTKAFKAGLAGDDEDE